MNIFRIATRKSPLALWQANEVKRLLLMHHPDLVIELLELSTQGDRVLDQSLSKIGGKGLFVKELELALLDERADIAVHSMKDVPMQLPAGLSLSVIMQRDDPRDAFISNNFMSLETLPPGACVGTSSLRRKMQLSANFPQLTIKDLRGNVGTRLTKLDDGNYDGIILAVAGLKRLGLSERITETVAIETILPAIGQAAIGIECRTNDQATKELLKPLADTDSSFCVCAERALNRRLEGGCHFPIAGFARLIDSEQLDLTAMVGTPDGTDTISDRILGPKNKAEQLGTELADMLIKKGGRALLEQFRASTGHGSH